MVPLGTVRPTTGEDIALGGIGPAAPAWDRNQNSLGAVQDSDVTDLHVMVWIQDQEQCHPAVRDQERNLFLQAPCWDRDAWFSRQDQLSDNRGK